jgi:hypothetical protein
MPEAALPAPGDARAASSAQPAGQSIDEWCDGQSTDGTGTVTLAERQLIAKVKRGKGDRYVVKRPLPTADGRSRPFVTAIDDDALQGQG